ncbi:MAG TPA: hypothetical protein VFA43_11500 [Gemmatimonadaceae bacterium]|nr:hypothetical protein [Gemmatimonadaceae bacterium]
MISFLVAAGCALTAARGDTASAVLARARHVLGMDDPGILVFTSREATSHAFESDRMYPPYLSLIDDHRVWLDLATGVERDSLAGPFGQSSVTLSDDHGVSGQRAAWAATERERGLEPRLVVHAWSSASDVRVAGRCRYRDYERVVLARNGTYGPEQLYLDPKTGFVVKLDRVEPHYLWGHVHVEYVYATWLLYGANTFGGGDVLMPTMSTRLVDGEDEITRSLNDVGHVSRDSAPSLVLPTTGIASTISTPGFLRPSPVDTVRLGPHAFVLANPGYNEVVTLINDTVYVLDATQGDERARTDSQWVARLFPGHHHVNVVVTDVAWPHVSGVRFWAARGATIISRETSRSFLERIIEHSGTMRFVPVHSSLVRPGLGLYAIDGIGSEGALMAYLPNDGVLYASDYVQTLDGPALYTTEVYAAACRFGLKPSRVVAEHHKVADWMTLVQVVQRQPIGDYPSACDSRG